MEANLFFIGCGLAAYAVVLKQFFKRESLIRNPFFSRFMHSAFYAVLGGLLGFVLSASIDLHGPSLKWPLIGFGGGLVWALVDIWLARQKEEGDARLLASDLEWSETSYSAIILAAVIMYCVVQAFKIPSGSMKDTLLIGDHLFVNKFIYGIRIPFTEKRVLKWRDVRRGDVVVFDCPPSALSPEDRAKGRKKDFIKRAIGLPGDEIRIKDKQLFVNGVPQKESYAVYKHSIIYPAQKELGAGHEYQALWESGDLSMIREGYSIRDNFGPIRVPENSYFVMGDNRDESFDGRYWGPLPIAKLKGKAWIVYWPFPRVKVIR